MSVQIALGGSLGCPRLAFPPRRQRGDQPAQSTSTATSRGDSSPSRGTSSTAARGTVWHQACPFFPKLQQVEHLLPLAVAVVQPGTGRQLPANTARAGDLSAYIHCAQTITVPSPQVGQMLSGVSLSSKELLGLRSPPYNPHSSLLLLLAGASNSSSLGPHSGLQVCLLALSAQDPQRDDQHPCSQISCGKSAFG